LTIESAAQAFTVAATAYMRWMERVAAEEAPVINIRELHRIVAALQAASADIPPINLKDESEEAAGVEEPESPSLSMSAAARRVHRTGEDVSGLVGMWGAFCCRPSVFVCRPTRVDSCDSNDEDSRIIFCSPAFKENRKNVAGYDAAIIGSRGGRFSLHTTRLKRVVVRKKSSLRARVRGSKRRRMVHLGRC